jgi:ribonuclease HI
MVLSIHTDGGSRHNPGPAASAFIIREESGKLIYQEGKFLGNTTNNQAEYRAVLFALEWLSQNQITNIHINFSLDSLLVVNQLSGLYKIKDIGLSQIASRIYTLIKEQKYICKFTHIPRSENSAADYLVNQTLDLHS